MLIPAAMYIEAAYDAIATATPADESEADQIACAKELHVANPAFLRGQSFEAFTLAARAYYLGLKTAALLAETGVKL